jgi:hypothetical protein
LVQIINIEKAVGVQFCATYKLEGLQAHLISMSRKA